MVHTAPNVTPRALRTFNVAVCVSSLWFFAGLLLDGWAHNHLDLSREGFFTPYHAVFYSGFAALAATLLSAAARNRAPGRPWYRSFPEGYGPMALGMAIFAAGGVLDMLWHIAFGIEQDTDALFSPTHLLLAAGGATMMTGPIRIGLARPDAATWHERWPELLALSMLASLITFFTMWAFDPGATIGEEPRRLYAALPSGPLGDVRDLAMQNGLTAVILRSLVMAAVTGYAARRFALPFGATAALVAVPNVLIALMLDPSGPPILLVLGAALVAGFAGDAVLARFGRLDEPSWRSRAYAFGVPFIFWAVELAATAMRSGGLWWSPHLAFGAPVIGGLAGLLLALASESQMCGRRDSNPQPTSS